MLNIALAAHVDAGKTTLSEYMLYLAGAVKTPGRVDHRDAFLDTDKMERTRGITIFSKQARFTWRKHACTLLDTPGHADFSGEAMRTLEVADVCVLLVSAPDGVQSHTRALWKLMEELGTPVWVFVNKMDYYTGDSQALLEALKKELNPSLVDVMAPEAGEQWAMCDDAALDYYLKTGAVPAFKRAQLVRERRAFPCFFGSALKGENVDALLDSLVSFEPERAQGPFGAKVFKVTRDAAGARVCFMKVLSGELHPRDTVSLYRENEILWSEKVTALRLYSGEKFAQTDLAGAGEIVGAVGMKNPVIGDELGAGTTQTAGTFLEPVFSRTVRCENADLHALTAALATLEDEEPLFHVEPDPGKNTVSVRLSGQVQLEVLQSQLQDRFGLKVHFEAPQVIYKETIADEVEGVGHFEPLRHYAEVHLWLSPGKRGSGVTVVSRLPLDDLAAPWQQQILRHLRGAPHRGVLTGARITDIVVELIAGKAHLKHTEGGDFREASERALRQGLMKARSVLLEPVMSAEIEMPRDDAGKILHELTLMKATWDTLEESGDVCRLKARVPARLSLDLPLKVRTLTGGRGRAEMSFLEYAPCDDEKVIAQFNYDPRRDLQNPVDSVFCAHGAGYTVPWDQVDQTAHLPLKKDKTDSMPDAPRRTAPVRYGGTREEDEELMRIFERTYGPVKARQLMPLRRSDPQPVTAPGAALPEEEILLVDGYNIVFAWEELKKQAQSSLEDARKRLCDLMCEYSAMTGRRVIVVFDAYRVPGGTGEAEKYGNIYIIYTRERETADAFIERVTYGVKGRVRVIVATSDGPEQTIVIGNEAIRMSARDLEKEMHQMRSMIRKYLDSPSPNPTPNLGEAIRDAWKNSRIK